MILRSILLCAALLGSCVGVSAAPPSPLALADVVRAVNTNAGVCLHVGAGDGSVTAHFAQSGKLMVHALERDAAKVRAGRDQLQRKGLYGQAAIETWTGKALPYADDIANVVVCQDATVADADLLRVLAPNGVGFVQRGKQWAVINKGWPKEFDEWTHARHGADGNMVSSDMAVAAPTTLRWVSGPAQDVGGQKWYYDHVLVTARGRNYYMYEKEVVARDSFNGALLWRRPVTAEVFRELGTEVPPFLRTKNAAKPPKQGTRTNKVRPVAIGSEVYVAADGKLFSLDGATGRTAAELGTVDTPRELLVVTNTIVVSDATGVRGFDRISRRKLWESPVITERIVAGDGKVFCLAGKTVAALDMETGSELWRSENQEIDPATTATYHGGTLVLEMSSWRDDAAGCGVVAYSGEEGKLLWKKEFKPDMTHYKEARAFFARDLVWLQSGQNQVIGYDPKTGEQKQTWGSRGKHCATPVATGRYFMAPECEFTDLETGERSRARMFKSACRLPFIPANGLLYTFPVQCECFPMLRGYMGMTAQPTPTAADGPSFERVAPPPAHTSALTPLTSHEWPMYRHDAYRSAATADRIDTNKLKEVWTVRLGRNSDAVAAEDWSDNPFVRGKVTPPVVAGGKVFASVPDLHQVVALDARSGSRKWQFTAGGRVDLPPTIHEGRCLFGAHDGWLYCLEAADGKLLWRRRIAPHEARMPAYGQLESPWPAVGSVLVENGIGYISAGRHPMCEGGVQVAAFDPRTGDSVWQKRIDDLTTVITNWYGPTIAPKVKTGLDFEPVDILVKDGDSVAMSRWRFNPASGDWKLALASTTYDAAGRKIPRGAWGYGIRQTKLVLPKRPLAFDETRIEQGSTNASALVLAGGIDISAMGRTLHAGPSQRPLKANVVTDGLAVAYGRIYACLEDGQVVCFE